MAEKQITLNEGMEWLKSLESRYAELSNLRSENSAARGRRYGVGGDKEVITYPTYSVKKLDSLITTIANEIRKLKAAIKQTNATARVIGYEANEEVLGTLEDAEYVPQQPKG
jgi:hypothetical protein